MSTELAAPQLNLPERGVSAQIYRVINSSQKSQLRRALRCRAFVILVASLAAMLLEGCTGKPSEVALQRAVPPSTDHFARQFIDAIRRCDTAIVGRILSPTFARVPHVLDTLSRFPQEFAPGMPDTTRLVGATVSTNAFGSNPVTTTVLSYELHSPGGWSFIRVALTEELGVRMVDGISVQRMPASLEQTYAFDLRGAGALQWCIAVMALTVALFSIFTAIQVARTPMPHHWFWALGALLGIGRFDLAWPTGTMNFVPDTVMLIAVSVAHPSLAAPWIVSFSIPVGAMIAYDRRRRALLFQSGQL